MATKIQRVKFHSLDVQKNGQVVIARDRQGKAVAGIKVANFRYGFQITDWANRVTVHCGNDLEISVMHSLDIQHDEDEFQKFLGFMTTSSYSDFITAAQNAGLLFWEDAETLTS